MPSHKKYRVIIRFSLDNDDKSKIRNSVFNKNLKKAGITNNKKTGAWESPSSDLILIQKQLAIVLDELANLSSDPEYKAVLDHLWIYIDKA